MRLAARNIFLTLSCDARIAGFGPRHGDGEEEDEGSKRVGYTLLLSLLLLLVMLLLVLLIVLQHILAHVPPNL